VVQLTKTLAVEWGGRGVRVNAIAPGWINTPIVQGLARRGLLDVDAIVRRTPMRRLGEIDDLAGPAIFLASDESAFVNGHTLVVDGGYLAYGFV
jgi:NAD(P)-dependent dehydrogenase (short-subunit alcohol dehydrogenase family)